MASLTREEVIAIVQETLARQGGGIVASHTHDGNDSPQLDPTFFLGFPVLSAAPTHTAPNGTIVLSDTGSTRKIHARLGGVWYAVTIT